MDIFQKAILQVRRLCEDASSSLTGIGQGDQAIALLSVQPDLTHTLEEFCHSQQVQTEEANKKILKLRKTVLGIVKNACEVGNCTRLV